MFESKEQLLQMASEYRSSKKTKMKCDLLIMDSWSGEFLLTPDQVDAIQYYYDNEKDNMSLLDYLKNGPSNDQEAHDKYFDFCSSLYNEVYDAFGWKKRDAENPDDDNDTEHLGYSDESLQTLALGILKPCYEFTVIDVYNDARCDTNTGFSYCVPDEDYSKILIALKDNRSLGYDYLVSQGVISAETDKNIRSAVIEDMEMCDNYNAFALIMTEINEDAHTLWGREKQCKNYETLCDDKVMIVFVLTEGNELCLETIDIDLAEDKKSITTIYSKIDLDRVLDLLKINDVSDDMYNALEQIAKPSDPSDKATYRVENILKWLEENNLSYEKKVGRLSDN